MTEKQERVLLLNGCEWYVYPEGTDGLDAFMEAFGRKDGFIPLNRLSVDVCLAPYFIESEIRRVYVNLRQVQTVEEDEIFLLPDRDAYDARLAEVAERVCVGCAHYEEERQGDNLEGHRDKLSLDGSCFLYTPIQKE